MKMRVTGLPLLPRRDDLFLSSLLSRPAWLRLAGALGLIGLVWLLIAWAVVLP
jgi:hypothetical protein